MEYRNLGRTGVKISPFILGTANFGGPTPEAEAIRMIHKALDAGINMIDTANSYQQGQSERIVGKALAGDRRRRVILATKVHFPQSEDPNDRGNSRRHIMHALPASLERLETDWVDLYQIHRPDFDIPQEETLSALNDVVRQGRVNYIGCSGFPAWKVMEALTISERNGLARYITEQPPYNLLDRRIENELVPLAQAHQLGLLTWAPLANGITAGRYARSDSFPPDSRAARFGPYMMERVNDRALAAGTRVAELAGDCGLTPSQLALLWVKEQPGVTAPILGPRTEAQLDDALKVMEMKLDQGVANALDEVVPPGSVVSDFHNTLGWMKTRLM